MRFGTVIEAVSFNPARALVFALVIAWAAVGLFANLTHWYLQDAEAYWQAAERLRTGQPLYVASSDLANPALYRYAPWFAFLWIPLTYLPHALVIAVWSGLLVAAATWLVWPSWRSPASIGLSLLLLPDLVRVTSTGNVQPLLLAALALPIPWLTGVVGSLKGWPLLLALRFGRRSWISFVVAAALWMPILAFDLSAYPQAIAPFTPGSFAIFLVLAKIVRRAPQSTASRP